jgi:hypothetical protein
MSSTRATPARLPGAEHKATPELDEIEDLGSTMLYRALVHVRPGLNLGSANDG